MNRIFLDANIVIDYLDQSSHDHSLAVDCVQIIRAYFGKPIVSPFTFLITNFIFAKFIKDKAKHKSQMKAVFSGLEITTVKSTAVRSVLDSSFIDLEDGLQYESALAGEANAIITKNVHDYFPAKLPIIHPHDFVSRFKEFLL